LASLFDQSKPFGRLALVHALMTAGDTLLTVSLAGSLFFSISPEAAKGRVLLYLLLTMAPFAVVAPVLGPAIDRNRGARRAMVVLSALMRAALCVVMARDIRSLLLFPEAFAMLVLSKVYLVTKGSLVPMLAGPSAAPEEQLAVLNARLGLLAALVGLLASLPAIAVLKLFGGGWVLRLNVLVFLAATVAGMRLPIRGRMRDPTTPADPAESLSAPPAGDHWAPPRLIADLGPRYETHPEVTLGLSAMSVLKGTVGFLTFLLAFSLRRMHAATWWYGFVLGASMAGMLAGVIVVPRLRKMFTEPQMLAASVWLVAAGAMLAFFKGGLVSQAALAFLVGLSGSAAKPAFDAIVQRYVPAAALGRAFARFETRLQLVWVLGAVIPCAVFHFARRGRHRDRRGGRDRWGFLPHGTEGHRPPTRNQSLSRRGSGWASRRPGGWTKGELTVSPGAHRARRAAVPTRAGGVRRTSCSTRG
jgi:hypothetical protein